MNLRTLGGLSVEGVAFRREKVLLLLAYLCVEGPQVRRRLAELFWPEAANPMNSLAQHLVHLRSLGDVLFEDGSRVESRIRCDVCALREAARQGRAADAVQHYGGPFLDALTIPLGADLEEWVYDTREAVARETRSALLTLASNAAAHAQSVQAGELAARALALPGAPPADELELPRLWHLLGLAGHPLAAQVEREARDLGLHLDVAPTPPPAPFVGREAHLDALAHLPPGQVAWISGHAGMGKTALLEALSRTGGWTVLHARSGLPYGTLEPLTRTPPTNAGAALATLRDPRMRVALDAWDTIDEATQAVIALAARQRPGAAIVVTARLHPPFEVDMHLHLDVLGPHDLKDHPGLYGQTEGHPTLVAAALRGQPLDVRQGARVRALPSAIRDTYLMLALQDHPDLRATRKAAGLSADEFALALSHLTQEGLTAEGGHVYAAAAARELLAQVPVHATLLHLKLARALPEGAAWPDYDAARDLWEDADEERAAKAASLRAADLLKRGYPGQAAALLDSFAERPELAVQHAWALLGVGRYAEALKRLETLTPHEQQMVGALVARATALVRMGRVDEAVILAGQVSGNSPEAAHAASVQAHAARIREEWEEARRFSQMAADLWQVNGDEEQRLRELVMVARVRVRLGADADATFASVLNATQGLPSVKGVALVNFAQVLIDAGRPDEADSVMQEAIETLKVSGDQIGLASALGNLGVRRHLQGRVREAAQLYKQALTYFGGTGNIRHLGQTLSNLSEIDGDLGAFEDSLQLLINAGQHELVAQIRRNAQILPNAPARPLHS